MKSVFYNENDPYAVEWLRRLSQKKHIARGVVDDRSIRDLKPKDVSAYDQAHFFAGVGGWPYALKLAGWPSTAPVWTGSCPCQPFSTAGRQKGDRDERHLWPTWFKLIRKCRPPIVFGEQVASPAGLRWLDAVQADLEGAGYAVGASDLCAAGVGAPHIRQRLYFVAVSREQRREGKRIYLRARKPRSSVPKASRRSEAHGVGHTGCARSGRHPRSVPGTETKGAEERLFARHFPDELVPPGATGNHWLETEWLICQDGKARPVEPGSFPLAYGVLARMGKLRAYGNAIVPQLAAAFIRASAEAMNATLRQLP